MLLISIRCFVGLLKKPPFWGMEENRSKRAGRSVGTGPRASPRSPRDGSVLFVIPAKAGIHLRVRVNTRRRFNSPPMRRNPDEKQKAKWIPAFAGMTVLLLA